MKTWKEVIDGIRKAVMASEVREDIAQGLEYVEQFANTAGENIQKAIDPTLSVSGKAADAAKVGEAVNAEAERAKAAERQNATGILAEVSRATGEEQRLNTAITAEKTRAEQAEHALSARTDALESCGFVVVDGKICVRYIKR